MSVVPLQKYIAECGISSRREAERFIREERVKVNGRLARLGETVNPEDDEVLVDDVPVQPCERIYIALNKPAGAITSSKPGNGARAICECVAGIDARLFPVGRLGKDEEGCLLLTNDGELAFRLIHPDFEVDGAYLAWVAGVVEPAALKRFEQGVDLGGEVPVRARVTLLYTGAKSTLLRIVLREGKKHSVRRLCAAVGYPVLELRRMAFADINVEGLKPGEWRRLTEAEVARLRRLVKLDATA